MLTVLIHTVMASASPIKAAKNPSANPTSTVLREGPKSNDRETLFKEIALMLSPKLKPSNKLSESMGKPLQIIHVLKSYAALCKQIGGIKDTETLRKILNRLRATGAIPARFLGGLQEKRAFKAYMSQYVRVVSSKSSAAPAPAKKAAAKVVKKAAAPAPAKKAAAKVVKKAATASAPVKKAAVKVVKKAAVPVKAPLAAVTTTPAKAAPAATAVITPPVERIVHVERLVPYEVLIDLTRISREQLQERLGETRRQMGGAIEQKRLLEQRQGEMRRRSFGPEADQQPMPEEDIRAMIQLETNIGLLNAELIRLGIEENMMLQLGIIEGERPYLYDFQRWAEVMRARDALENSSRTLLEQPNFPRVPENVPAEMGQLRDGFEMAQRFLENQADAIERTYLPREAQAEADRRVQADFAENVAGGQNNPPQEQPQGPFAVEEQEGDAVYQNVDVGGRGLHPEDPLREQGEEDVRQEPFLEEQERVNVQPAGPPQADDQQAAGSQGTPPRQPKRRGR